MLDNVAIFALVMSGLNWLVFVVIAFLNDVPLLDDLLRRMGQAVAAKPVVTPMTSLAMTEQQGQSVEKVLDSAGKLAGAFKKAGSAPTAAAMSLACLVIAVLAAGLDKIP